MFRLKKVLLYILVFNLTYAPVVPTVFAADNTSTDSQKQNTENLTPQAITPQEQAEINKGSTINIDVENAGLFGGAKSPLSRVTITPGTDPQAVYEAGRPSVIRSKMGSLMHYVALRNSEKEFNPFAPVEEQRDKKDALTLRDIKKGAIHFYNENLTFNLALFSVKLIGLTKKYSSNPIAFEELIDSAKDPIGYISFYAFMVVNGYAADFLNDVSFSNSAKGQMMKKTFASVIPYLSMTAGSMASHITGDTLHLLQACSKNLDLRGRGQIPAMEQANPQADPCEMAWKDWTIEKKFHVYGPSIISMLAATFTSGLVTKSLTASFSKIKSVAMSKAEESAVARGFIRFSLVGSRFGAAAVRSGALRWTFMIVGKTPNFILFLGLTELFEPLITPQFENFTRTQLSVLPGINTFTTLSDKFMKVILQEKKRNWRDGEETATECETNPGIALMGGLGLAANALLSPFKGKCKSGDILNWLNEFSEFMQSWRDFNQSHPMMSHSAWVRKINNLKNTERLAYYYNNKMLEDLQDYKTAEKIKLENKSIEKLNQKDKKPKDAYAQLSDVDRNLNARYQSSVMRLYPLFGVKPDQYVKNEKQLYLTNPDALEEDQLVTIKKSVNEFLVKQLASLRPNLNENDKKFFDSIVIELNTKNKFQIATTFNKIREVLFGYKERKTFAREGFSGPGGSLLIKFYASLGNPRPLLQYGLGFAHAFTEGASSIIIDAATQVSAANYLDEVKQDYKFGPYLSALKVDYLTYNMVCGIDLFNGNKGMIDEWFGFSDEFIPPRIVKSSVSADICDLSENVKAKSSDRMYEDQILDKANNNKSYKGIFSLIIPNLRPELNGLISVDRKKDSPRFAYWWNDVVEPVIRRQFEKYRSQYEEIAVDLAKTLYWEDALINKGTVKNSIAYSTMQEMRMYSLIMAELVRDKIRTKEITSNVPFFQTVPAEQLIGWQPVTAKTNADIFKYQVLPYNGDLFFLNETGVSKKGKVPQIYAFQTEVENLINHYHNVLSKIKIEQPYGKERVSIKFSQEDMENFNKQKSQTEAVFKSLIEHFAANENSSSDAERAMYILNFCTTKIIALAAQIEGLVAQLRVVEYNRDSGPLKEECKSVNLGMKKTNSGKCN
ncbi:MAG: hypothetical protein AABY64_01655 [Bdellovibrionota bacterium]